MSTTGDHSAELEVYELGYLVLPSIPEDSLSKVVETLKSIVKKAGGTELDGEEPFKRDLAYSMSKVVGASKYVVDDAYLGWMKFEAEPSSIEEIKGEVEKLDVILRILLIKAPRESAFTFAKAREAAEEKERAEAESVAEARAEEAEAEADEPEADGSSDAI